MRQDTTSFNAHGGKLKQLIITDSKQKNSLIEKFENAKKLTLTHKQLCDLELLLNGGFSPLDGFMDEKTYHSVVDNMRLPTGIVWPIPITLDVPGAKEYNKGDTLLLYDRFNEPYALFTITSIYKPDKTKEAKKVYGTTDKNHFGVKQLFEVMGDYYLGGKIEGLKEVGHYNFREYRHSPMTVRNQFKKLGWEKIIGFQTRNPLHKAHYALIKDAADSLNANVLLHPSVGRTKDGDIDYITRTKCYIQLYKNYMDKFTFLSLLPLAMRMAGPREALLHAIIRRNYGCTHFIIGRDHASPGKDANGKPYYGDYQAHDLVKSFEKELGIKPIYVKEMVYVKEEKKFLPITKVKKGQTVARISGTEIRERLRNNKPIPQWFSFPEIIKELRINEMKKREKGLTIFFTGLPSSGKSTLARSLRYKLMDIQNKEISLLDGDIIRKTLSKGLGFSKEDRFINITRIGFVANEITKHKGIAICAAIAPYEDARDTNRKLISETGNYLEIFLSTPLDICIKRDVKGLYRKAKKNKLEKMTGIDDSYEPPKKSEIIIDTSKKTIDECIEEIVSYLQTNNLIN